MGFLKFPHESSLRNPEIKIIEHLEDGWVVFGALKLIFGLTKNIILCVLDCAIEGKKDSKTKMDLVLTN